MSQETTEQKTVRGVNRLAAGLAVGALGSFLSLIFSVWMLSSSAGQGLIMGWLELHPTVIQGIPETTLDSLIFVLSNVIYGFIDGFILGYLGALFYGIFNGCLMRRRNKKQQGQAISQSAE